MKTGLIPHRLALAAALALSSCGVFAGELHALSESEMSSVYGRGLAAPTLDALGALTTKEQSSSGLSATDAAPLAMAARPCFELRKVGTMATRSLPLALAGTSDDGRCAIS